MSSRKKKKTASASGDKKSDKIETPKVLCDNCNKDVTDKVRIKCATCEDLDMCVDCFAVGTETGDHKSSHPYRVMDRLNYPVLERNWTANEELLLLEAIEMYGYGNWEDIADHVGTKSPLLCMAHYEELYINSTEQMPDATDVREPFVSRDTWFKNNPESKEAKLLAAGENPDRRRDPDAVTEPSVNKSAPKDTKMTAAAELAGYYPLREDFDTEHNHDAELDIKDIEFTDADEPLDRHLKLTLLDIYKNQLADRRERKAFVFERGLIDPKQAAIERRRLKDEKELYNNMRMFARFQSAEEHNKLMDGLVAELTVRKEIASLQQLRSIGVTTIDQSALKRKRGDDVRSQRAARYANRDKPAVREDHVPLDLEGAAGVDLLSDKERDLCSVLSLWPQQYIMIKNTLLKEFCKTGSLHKNAAMQLVKIDVTKTSKIYDFFVQSGWVAYHPPKSDGVLSPRPGGSVTSYSHVPLAPVGMLPGVGP